MLNVNLRKLLSRCGIPPGDDILLPQYSPCHHNLPGQPGLDVLTEGYELIFRCPTCEYSYAAPSFLQKVMKLSNIETEKELISCGYSSIDTRDMMDRDRKYLLFMDLFRDGRAGHWDNVELDNRRPRSFGDWSDIQGADLNRVFYGGKNKDWFAIENRYSVLLMRDENGIPSSINVFTPFGSFIGSFKLPIPSSQGRLIAAQWTDSVSWVRNLVLCQTPGTAQVVSDSMHTAEKLPNYPVAQIAEMNGPAVFIHRLNPSIIAILDREEQASKIASFHGMQHPVKVSRLPGVEREGLNMTTRFEEHIKARPPIALCNDIIGWCSTRRSGDPLDFCNEFLYLPHVQNFYQEDIIDAYCDSYDFPKDKMVQIVNSHGSGTLQVVAQNKIFRIYNGTYACLNKEKWVFEPSCNFWIEITNIYRDPQSEALEYSGIVHINSKSAPFCCPSDVFEVNIDLIKEMTKVAVNNGLDLPMVTNYYLQRNLSSVVKGLLGRLPKVQDKSVYGLFAGKFTTPAWRVTKMGLEIGNFPVGAVRITDSEISLLSDPATYRVHAMNSIHEIGKSDTHARLLYGIVHYLDSIFTRGRGHLVVPQQAIYVLSSMLGIQVSEEIIKTNMIQVIDFPLTGADRRYQGNIISVFSPENIYNNDTAILNCFGLYDPSKTTGVPLLPFLMEAIVTRGFDETINLISECINREEFSQDFLKSHRFIQTGNARSTEFMNLIASEPIFSRYIIHEDETDSVLIDPKVLEALLVYGHKFRKRLLINELRVKYPDMKYPARRRSGASRRSNYIQLPNPNPISTSRESQKEAQKKTTHISNG